MRSALRARSSRWASTCAAPRRAAHAFEPAHDDAVIEALIEQVRATTAQAEAAIDEALAFIEASNGRIAALESQRPRAAEPPRV